MEININVQKIHSSVNLNAHIKFGTVIVPSYDGYHPLKPNNFRRTLYSFPLFYHSGTICRSRLEKFLDLQCPYSLTCSDQLAAIRERFGSEYGISIHLTSLLFHPQALPAQCAACMIEGKKGTEAKLKFVNACSANQDKYMNAATGDSRPSEVHARIFDDEFTEEDVCAKSAIEKSVSTLRTPSTRRRSPLECTERQSTPSTAGSFQTQRALGD
jgi:hypothetical protein